TDVPTKLSVVGPSLDAHRVCAVQSLQHYASGVDDVDGHIGAIGGVDNCLYFRSPFEGMQKTFRKYNDALAAWNFPIRECQGAQGYKHSAGLQGVRRRDPAPKDITRVHHWIRWCWPSAGVRRQVDGIILHLVEFILALLPLECCKSPRRHASLQ